MAVPLLKQFADRSVVRLGLALAAAGLLAATDLVLFGLPAPALTTADQPAAARVVEPSATSDSVTAIQATLSRCSEQPTAAETACYRQALVQRLATAGVEDALATLKALAALDGDVARDGHVYAHGIGIDAYRLSQSVDTIFARCSAIFASGCYHGVMQAYLEDRSSVDADAVNRVCQAYGDVGQSRWLFFQCLHGMGHGLNMFYDHDLPRALDACDLLADAWERESCYWGAFMENIMHATSPHHPATQLDAKPRVAAAGGHAHDATARDPASGGLGLELPRPRFRPLDPADPLYPCSIMSRRYLTACYLIQTAAILHLNGGDIADAAGSCDRAPRPSRPTCYQSLGRDITSYARQDPDESSRLCSLGSARYQRWCYFGVAKSLIDWGATTEPGFTFCGKVGGSRNRLKCYEAVGEQIAALERANSQRAALCERAESSESVDACRYGARLTRHAPA